MPTDVKQRIHELVHRIDATQPAVELADVMRARPARGPRVRSQLVVAAVVVLAVAIGVSLIASRRSTSHDVSVQPPVPAVAPAPIVGGGSGFAATALDQWRADAGVAALRLQVSYVAQGIAAGNRLFADRTFDYAATELPFTTEELNALHNGRCAGVPDGSCYTFVPIASESVGPMYDVTDASGNRITNLRLTRRAACAIFTGAITRWDDPQIVAANPTLRSVHTAIIPVLDLMDSATSYAFSQMCIAHAPDLWQTFTGGDTPVRIWPHLPGPARYATFDDGVSDVVADPGKGVGTIALVPASYAKVRAFPIATLQNGGPSLTSYVVAPLVGIDPGRARTLDEFLCYAIGTGQRELPLLQYAKLSSAARATAVERISRIPGFDANGCRAQARRRATS
jgi:ABC-type phosphate transport system substrate-binding protein